MLGRHTLHSAGTQVPQTPPRVPGKCDFIPGMLQAAGKITTFPLSGV